MLVRPPARQPRAASADTRPSTRGPAPAEETAPAAQAASPAAPPPEGAPGAQGAETTAPACRIAAPTTSPGAPPAQGGVPGAGPGRLAGSRRCRRGWRRGCRRSRDRGPGEPHHRPSRPRHGSQHAAGAWDGPCAGLERLAGGRRRHSGGQGGRHVPRPRQPQPHPHQPPGAVPPPRPPSLRQERGTSAPRHPSVRRQASRCRSSGRSRTPGA